jgi:hypothetical protein
MATDDRAASPTAPPSPTEPYAGGGNGPGRPGAMGFRAAALAGAATLPLLVAASMLSDLAGTAGIDPGSSDAELIDAFVGHRNALMVSASLSSAAAALTLVFLGPLWRVIRPGSEPLAVVAVAAGGVAAVLWVAGSGGPW